MTPPRFGQPPAIRTQLSHWNDVIDGCLAASRAEDALPLIRIILTSLPRHLPTYFRLLQVVWLMRRWHEGREWALRLLSADPGSELAWAVLARCAEADGELALAQRYWTLALENAPYNRPIRQGLSRTLLRQKRPLMLTRPALATLYRMGGRWKRAIRIYAELDPKRNRAGSTFAAIYSKLLGTVVTPRRRCTWRVTWSRSTPTCCWAGSFPPASAMKTTRHWPRRRLWPWTPTESTQSHASQIRMPSPSLPTSPSRQKTRPC